jgi:hypothetical protein
LCGDLSPSLPRAADGQPDRSGMVSNKERARRAIDAMTALGFSKKESTPVLRSLLKLFDNSWEPIEDECYRALADAVLDNRERLKVSVLPKWKRQKVFFLGIIMGSKKGQKDPSFVYYYSVPIRLKLLTDASSFAAA